MSPENRKAAVRHRWEWVEATLADPDLHATEKNILVLLATHRNDFTGQCNPAVQTIARGIGAKDCRNVQKVLPGLEKKGRIVRRMGGHGPKDTTDYTLLPAHDGTTIGGGRMNGGTPFDDGPRMNPSAPFQQDTRVNESNGRMNGERSKGEPDAGNGCQAGHPNLPNQENQDEPVCDHSPGPDIEIIGVDEDGQQLSESESDRHFEEFWQNCPRKVGYGKARSEYRKAINGGKATPAQLLGAIMAYSAARAEADQDEYTKTPAKWLSDECWNDDPQAHALGSGRGGGAWRKALKKLRNDLAAAPFEQQSDQDQPSPPGSSQGPVPAVDERWTKVKSQLADELGEKIYKRFFAELEFEYVGREIVYLRTPAPFDADKIQREYQEVLLRHCRTEWPDAESVVVKFGTPLRRTGT